MRDVLSVNRIDQLLVLPVLGERDRRHRTGGLGQAGVFAIAVPVAEVGMGRVDGSGTFGRLLVEGKGGLVVLGGIGDADVFGRTEDNQMSATSGTIERTAETVW